MGRACMLIGPSDTLWNMLTLVPITTASTSTSEVRKLDKLKIFSLNQDDNGEFGN